MNSPFFSIITVCRNAASTLPRALESLAAQTSGDWEWIMVDGDSSDASVEVARLLKGKGKGGCVISEPDQGIYDAMNKGVDRSRGRYLYFLNADDSLFDSNVLEDVRNALMEESDAPDFLYGDINVEEAGKPDTLYHSPEPRLAAKEMICGCLPHQGSFARRELFESRPGAFDASLRSAGDYKWMLDLLADPTVRIQRLDRTIANFSLSGCSSELTRSLPESFRVLNENEAFLSLMTRPDLAACFQEQILTLRTELQVARQENAKLRSRSETLQSRLNTLDRPQPVPSLLKRIARRLGMNRGAPQEMNQSSVPARH